MDLPTAGDRESAEEEGTDEYVGRRTDPAQVGPQQSLVELGRGEWRCERHRIRHPVWPRSAKKRLRSWSPDKMPSCPQSLGDSAGFQPS